MASNFPEVRKQTADPVRGLGLSPHWESLLHRPHLHSELSLLRDLSLPIKRELPPGQRFALFGFIYSPQSRYLSHHNTSTICKENLALGLSFPDVFNFSDCAFYSLKCEKINFALGIFMSKQDRSFLSSYLSIFNDFPKCRLKEEDWTEIMSS